VSLGLAYHALGTYDIFLAQDAHICSAAAGLLIASEAQAVVKHTQQNERMLSEILSAHSGIKKS
jgi:fructose-1,6-bisphosphatase/inositol monophosphatase family enzyme